MSLTKLLGTFKDEKELVRIDDKFIEKQKFGISLKGVLQRGRIKLQREKPHRRQYKSFSPSMITYNYCRRLKVGQLADIAPDYFQLVRPSEQIVMDIGSALHEIIQQYFWDIGILKGTYKCTKCEEYFGNLVSPVSCPKGHPKKYLKYKEIRLRDEEYMVSGRADGILIIDDKEHLMDIKSIQNRLPKSQERQVCFEDLDQLGPKSEHEIQLIFYMWMSGIENGHLLYVARNTGQIKTFQVPYDFSKIEPYLEEIKSLMNLAENYKKGIRVELPVPCGRDDCPCHKI